AINAIVARHESLRTHITESGGEPTQVIEATRYVPLPFTDVTGYADGERQSAVELAARREWEMPFDLATGPLLRFRLLKTAADEHVLLRTFHHIVSDGWSAGVFNRELVVLYEAFRRGAPDPLPALSVQYADFALWQRSWLDERGLQAALDYWRRQLSGIPAQLQLPTDRPRPAAQSYAADACGAGIDAETMEALARVSQAHGATPYMTLLAAFAVVLHAYSGSDDIVIGSPIANRQEAQLEQLIGFFVNTLAMRVRV